MRLRIVSQMVKTVSGNEIQVWVVVDESGKALPGQPAGWVSRSNALIFGARHGRVVLAGA